MKILPALLLLAVGMTTTTPAAFAQQEASAATKQALKKTSTKKRAPAKDSAVDEDDREPDISASTNIDYNCELGNTLTIYRNADDNRHIALRWKKQLLRLVRVETTTGANRFENRKNGWVWIDIPAKGMLLDARKGQQLANECRSPEQLTSPIPEKKSQGKTPEKAPNASKKDTKQAYA